MKQMTEDRNCLYRDVANKVYGDVEMYNVLHKTIDVNLSSIGFCS
jgi:hypothetical protein